MRMIRVAPAGAYPTDRQERWQVAPSLVFGVASRSIRSIVASLVILTGLFSAASAAQEADGSSVTVSIDAPTPGQQLRIGDAITFGGWAADPGATSAVDTVEVYLDGKKDEGGRLLGRATYGKRRTDVALALGNYALANVGFDLVWRVSATPGPHTAYIYAHSPKGWTSENVSFTVAGQIGVPGVGNVPGAQSAQYPAGLAGAASSAQYGATGQYLGNQVNIGPVTTGSGNPALGQTFGSSGSGTQYSSVPATGSALGAGYAGAASYPGTTGYQQSLGTAYGSGAPAATSPAYAAGPTSPCTCSSGVSATSPYATGVASYPATAAYSAQPSIALGSPYAGVAGSPYSTGYGAGYGTAGYGNTGYASYPNAYSATATYPAGAVSPQYGATSPYASGGYYAGASSYGSPQGYSSSYGYPSTPYPGY